jgi:transposase-like protein
MSRKPRVQRTPEEKWQIVLEGLKSGNVAETCRKYEIAPNLYYRWQFCSEGCATQPSAAAKGVDHQSMCARSHWTLPSRER